MINLIYLDIELAAKSIQSIKFENTSSIYSLNGKLLFDLEREEDKHIIYKMFVARERVMDPVLLH